MLCGPATAGLTNNYVASPASQSSLHRADGRVDRKLSSKDTLFSRFSADWSGMVIPDTFNHDIGGNEVRFAGDESVKGRNLVAAKTHIFSPGTIGDFRYRNINFWFDAAAFTTPPAFTWGTLGWNSMNAPALYNLDLSVAKRLPLGEARELQLRTEFFNSLNHPEFGVPNATAGVAGAGTIATTHRANRQIQFARRLQFDRRCPSPEVHGCGGRVQ